MAGMSGSDEQQSTSASEGQRSTEHDSKDTANSSQGPSTREEALNKHQQGPTTQSPSSAEGRTVFVDDRGSSTSPPPPPPPPVYELRPSNLHGQGFHANRTISAGEKIFSKQPLMSLARDLSLVENGQESFDDFDQTVKRFKGDELRRLWLMSLHLRNYEHMSRLEFKTALSQPGYGIVNDIFRAFKIPCTLSGRPWSLADPDFFFLNHSCTPNAELSSANENTYFEAMGRVILHHPATVVLRATKTIGRHEEITIAYVDPFQDSTRREAAFGKVCNCTECSLGPIQLQFSNLTRESMRKHLVRIRAFNQEYRILDDQPAKEAVMLQKLKDDERIDEVYDHVLDLLGSVQAANMETLALEDVAKIGAVIQLAKAFKCADPKLRLNHLSNAMTCKLKQVEILIKCLGVDHPDTKRFLLHLSDCAFGSPALDLYRAWKAVTPGVS